MIKINTLKLYINTLNNLKVIQIYYRLFYLIRNKFCLNSRTLKKYNSIVHLSLEYNLLNNISFSPNDNSFIFLNNKHKFFKKVDWNYSNLGKLWTYNLNYFDFLHQKDMSKEIGRDLILQYINNDSILKDGKEPYTISLRGINWIKFLCYHNINEHIINQTLYNHYQLLLNNLEYHLLGNHLLENAFSLLFGAYYFKDEMLYIKSKKLLISELKEQVLNDGAHFELSPMYHQIILWRLLDCISLLKHNKWKNDEVFYSFLKFNATKMLSFSNKITYSNGDIPMVNDSAHNIAPSFNEIMDFAHKLGLIYSPIELDDSGYRKVNTDNYELFVDIGEIGPSYQAGHAHADMLNFELYLNGAPFIVDTGTSTYENNELRQVERSTQSHNTVTINSKNQSEVWGGFRVGRRAKIVKQEQSNKLLEGAHDGYYKLVGLHSRQFSSSNSNLTIIDTFSKYTHVKAEANFHFYSDVNINIINDNSIECNNGVKMKFDSTEKIKLTKEYYQLAKGFNTTSKSQKLIVKFKNSLKTTIEI